jgi:hypothetical protein
MIASIWDKRKIMYDLATLTTEDLLSQARQRIRLKVVSNDNLSSHPDYWGDGVVIELMVREIERLRAGGDPAAIGNFALPDGLEEEE